MDGRFKSTTYGKPHINNNNNTNDNIYGAVIVAKAIANPIHEILSFKGIKM